MPNQISHLDFTPGFGLRNRHIQTIFSSIGPRKRAVAKRFARHERRQQDVTIDCGEGVRLQGFYNLASDKPSARLVIMIHGWEGSHESTYMRSLAATLLERGIDTFRLNLRDHGGSHGLNHGLFNSTLIHEVIDAVEEIQAKYEYQSYNMVGYSLGGNFSLRVAAKSQDRRISLDSVIAFCPVMEPNNSNSALLESQNWLYEKYFVRKWKRSLRKKEQAWPDSYLFSKDLAAHKGLRSMNAVFVPQYTAFDDPDTYFKAYAITDEIMQQTICPCYLHFAEDDMIIPVEDVDNIANNPQLHITVTKYGGHCGYIQNWRWANWQDQRVIDLLGLT